MFYLSPSRFLLPPPKSSRKMKISTLRAHNMWAFSLLFDPQVVYGFELCQNIYISTFHVYFPRSLPWCRRLIKHFGRWPTSTTHGRRRRSGRWRRLSIQSRWSAANISSKNTHIHYRSRCSPQEDGCEYIRNGTKRNTGDLPGPSTEGFNLTAI